MSSRRHTANERVDCGMSHARRTLFSTGKNHVTRARIGCRRPPSHAAMRRKSAANYSEKHLSGNFQKHATLFALRRVCPHHVLFFHPRRTSASRWRAVFLRIDARQLNLRPAFLCTLSVCIRCALHVLFRACLQALGGATHPPFYFNPQTCLSQSIATAR